MPTSPAFSTADLSDANGDRCHPCSTQLRQFGGKPIFSGRIRTVRCRGDNLLIRQQLEGSTAAEVLVVDGGGDLEFALLGDMLAGIGARNGWVGAVIFGAVRDSVALAAIDFGVKALGTNPRRGTKQGTGEVDVAVTFGGVTFVPGHWLYSDADGILVAAAPLAGV